MRVKESKAIYEYITNKYLKLVFDCDIYRGQPVYSEKGTNNDYGHSTIHYSEEMGSLWAIKLLGSDKWLVAYSDPKSYHFMTEQEVKEEFNLYAHLVESSERLNKMYSK